MQYVQPSVGGTIYRGNPYTSFPAILVWAMLLPLFILTLLTIKALHPIAFFMGGILFIIFRVVTNSLYYFEVNSTSLIVHKYFRPGRIIEYTYNEISDVRFIKVKMAIHIEVKSIFSDSKTYPAATLTRDTALALQMKLEQQRVNITSRL